jgi:hypothetical protein
MAEATRPPERSDLLRLCAELNRLGAKYVTFFTLYKCASVRTSNGCHSSGSRTNISSGCLYPLRTASNPKTNISIFPFLICFPGPYVPKHAFLWSVRAFPDSPIGLPQVFRSFLNLFSRRSPSQPIGRSVYFDEVVHRTRPSGVLTRIKRKRVPRRTAERLRSISFLRCNASLPPAMLT